MHGFSSGSTFLVNAEVDSMGGVVDGGVGIGTKSSLRRLAIEKAQAELRLEYDVREERRRELEFLENGGDPLDFRIGHLASSGVQSTSRTTEHPDQNLTSEAKGSFALSASPHRDSAESCGRLGVTTALEPNSADNFDGNNEILQNDRKSILPGRSYTTPSEHSSQLDRVHDIKDLEDSRVSPPKKSQLYKRRNRSRPRRDDPRSSVDLASRGRQNPEDMQNPSLNVSNSKEKLEDLQNLSSKTDEALATISTVEPNIVVGRDSIDSLDVVCPPSSDAEKKEYNNSSKQLNETSKVNGVDNCTPTDAIISNAPVVTNGIDSEPSCKQTNISVDGNGNIDSDMCSNFKNVDSNGSPKEHAVPAGENSANKDDKIPNEDHVTNAMESASGINEGQSSISHQGNGSVEEDHAKGVSHAEVQENNNEGEIKSEKEVGKVDNCFPNAQSSCPVRSPTGPALDESNRNGFSGPPEIQPCTENQSKPLDKAQEDKILEEARLIVAKRKRIATLSTDLVLREQRRKCHWDLVLEEMAWLANDFAQERRWKIMAAAQNCRRVAIASRIRLEEQSKISKQESVAHSLAKAVMEFWHTARVSAENAGSSQAEKCNSEASMVDNETDSVSLDMLQSTRRKQTPAVHGYAVRWLQFNCSTKSSVEVEEPGVTDLATDIGLPELLWQDQFTEENLFYTVPPGAMEMYRKSIESCLAESERIRNSIQEEAVSSVHAAATDCGYEDNDYEEDEGGHLYYHPGASNAAKLSKKKRKNMKAYAARSHEFGGDVGYGNYAEIRNGPSQLNIVVKRPTTNLHVDPIPMRRMRTASRQRVVGPFGACSVGVAPVLSKADGSSEDTNSFHDDQNTSHGGAIAQRGVEVDSTMNFEKQATYDYAEISAKPKKKKKLKHQGSSYDHRWQLDSSMPNEQKDLVRKRLDEHQLESIGNGSLFGRHAKKPKLAKHSLDNSFDNISPMSGSVASPVASQMSNMPSQSKLFKFLGGRDRGKKGKGLKVLSGQLGSGSPWTMVEDQALVVLVHDMGPNWELVSDAMNSILQFKCIFRKSQECKERHKYLMDMPSGDGADSGEDSGSSQPYPSTLPGIPQGSARQLFRSLHEHVEEDNIKSHLEKIIRIGQQLYFRRKKNNNQDFKQIAPAHSSHLLSLSQVIPNNINGGVLTPLDLCDSAASSQDPLIGFQSPHAGSLPPPNQNNIPSIHASNGLNSPHQGLQGSPNIAAGNNLASPLSQLTNARDGRSAVQRSLPIEEQQRLHQYNSALPGRNLQASNLSSSGSDRGVRVHPSGNGASRMPGVNRNIPMSRPGRVQGIPSSSVPNSASVLASNMSIMHSGTAPNRGNGNAVFKPRDSLHGVQTGKSSEHQRQTPLPAMSQTSSSTGFPAFAGPTSGFSNNQAFPHGPTPEQQAFVRMQQRLLQQQQQQQQLPLSTPSSSQPVSLPHVGPVPSEQQKNVQGRQHPHQRQKPQQNAPKHTKVPVRGNMATRQNLPIDSSHLNGLNSASSATQVQPISSPNHHQLLRQPSLKVVNKSQPGLNRQSQQNRQLNSDSLPKSKVDSASNIVKKLPESVCDSSMGTECFSPVSQDNNLVSREHDEQLQQEESQLPPPPSKPILPQKQQGEQSGVFTGNTNSRPD